MSFDPRHTQSHIEEPIAPVIALRETKTGRTFMLDGQRWVVGSAANCDIVVEDDLLVSRRHCTIERKSDMALFVRDAPSRNGTFIDGYRIDSAELRPGQTLMMGATQFLAIASTGALQRKAMELIRGRDPILLRTLDEARLAASSPCNVLILGETGTGKELIARAIHEGSQRRNSKFVTVNCGALPRELAAGLLFGHEKGAYTGADDSHIGYFVEANGGTLFLDEIGELPLDVQPQLLRVLETMRVRPLGLNREIQLDVRIVAATNQLAVSGIGNERMRQDLYHRLAQICLELSPLRERMADLGELVEAFLEESIETHGLKQITIDGWAALTEYDWPGNVRELRATIRRALVLAPGDQLRAEHFFPSHHPRNRVPVASPSLPPTPGPYGMAPYNETLRNTMEQALIRHRTVRAAAKSIGMPKSTFADKARAWRLASKRRFSLTNPTRKRK